MAVLGERLRSMLGAKQPFKFGVMLRNSFPRSFAHSLPLFNVARETSDVNSSTGEPIEIPPPRPKRKPMHPYPRKLSLNAGKESQLELRSRSTSPHSSLSELDNRSPTSVLSTVISDTPPSEDGTIPNGSPLPISSGDIRSQAEDEEHLKQADVQKLELFPNICAIDGEDCTAGKVLKLFGKNVVIPSKPSNSSTHTSISPFPDIDEGAAESSIENRLVDIEMTNFESSRNYFDGVDNSKDGNAIQVEKPIPLPWWVLYRDTAIPPFGCKETEVEESCDGSNSGSVNDEADTTMNWDPETQLGRCVPQAGEDDKPFDNPNPSLLKRKTSCYKIGKGFVPYKRCFSERDMQSSTIRSDDGECQRIRLCL